MSLEQDLGGGYWRLLVDGVEVVSSALQGPTIWDTGALKGPLRTYYLGYWSPKGAFKDLLFGILEP